MRGTGKRLLTALTLSAALVGCGSAAATPSMQPPPSAPSEVPSLPTPAGSTLLNDQLEAPSSSVSRITSWQSGQPYEATVSFYGGLSDARWHLQGTPNLTPQATDFALTDSQGIYEKVEVEIDRTDPVRIAVRFLQKGEPAPTIGAGPTMVIHPLPHASALPDGFPAAFVPAGSTLYDASVMGTTYFAIFVSNIDPTTYLGQVRNIAPDAQATMTGGVTTITFTHDGHQGGAVLDPSAGQLSVEVTR